MVTESLTHLFFSHLTMVISNKTGHVYDKDVDKGTAADGSDAHLGSGKQEPDTGRNGREERGKEEGREK